MKIWSTMMAAAMSLTMALSSFNAEAKRLGGGGSSGKQSSNVTQRDAKPAAPAVQPSPAAAPRKPWGAMLGGLAAGLGLAWLAHSLGMGEAFGQVLMFALLALAVMVVVGLIMRKMRASRQGAAQQSPFAFQGAGSANTPTQYSANNVGNDASARPWEQAATRFETNAPSNSSGSMIGSALNGAQSSWGIPAGFDVKNFLDAARQNFTTLQDAWDRSDISALRVMMTDDMLEQIKAQLAERESQTGGAANKTDVLTLDAQLLGIEELDDSYLASVEFSGMIREDQSAGPSPFREVWNMTKPRHAAGGWLVAGVQALQ